MRRGGPVLITTAAAVLLAACGSYSGAAPPTWQPSPGVPTTDAPGERGSPILPVPSGPAGGGPGSGGSSVPGNGGGNPSPSPTAGRKVDPNVVATHLTAPVGLTLLPDGTALVGERTTGRIVRVQPKPGQPVPTVRTLHGLDTSGDGGLLDLALSPTYAEDGLIYAYVTTRTDNRVVEFTLTGPVTPVFTGIPKGRTGNIGRIVFGSDADLYIGTGDTGHPALAAKRSSLAGKVLRVDDIGDPAEGNPTPSSPVWTTGHHVVDGLCPVPQTHWLLEAERGPSDEVNVLSAGVDYGWPAPTVGSRPPIARSPDAYRTFGGCTVLGTRVWVTSLAGKALLSAPLHPSRTLLSAGRFTAVLKNKYGRLRTVVAAPDGALWLTTSNRDGHGKPVAADERVIRFVPGANAEGAPF